MELGFAGVVLVFTEFLVFEILNLMAGWISVTHLSTMAILCTIYSTLKSISYGLNVALTTRVGEAIGSSNKRAIKKYTELGNWISIIISVLIGLFLLVFSPKMVTIFTHDKAIINMSTLAIPAFALAIIPDAY